MPDSMSILNSVGVNTALYQPIFFASQASPQSVATGFGGQSFNLGTPAIDTYGGWSGGTPSRYTPTTPGWYSLIGSVQWPVNASGCRVASVLKNGTSVGGFSNTMNALSTASYFPTHQITGLFQMNGTTDYVEVWGYQDSGGSLTTVTGGTYLIVTRIHL